MWAYGGKEFWGTFGKACLHESMGYAFGRVLPSWSKVALLCVSIVTRSPFAMAFVWVVAITCHNKFLKSILDISLARGVMVTLDPIRWE